MRKGERSVALFFVARAQPSAAEIRETLPKGALIHSFHTS